jgi:hypothetical protein
MTLLKTLTTLSILCFLFIQNSFANDRFEEDNALKNILEQQAFIKASNTNPNDWFGYSVAIDGSTLVVGAPREGSSATGINGNQDNNSEAKSGAAYVFERINGNWFQQAYLKASNTGADDNFGWSVDIYQDTIVVGAKGEDSSGVGVNGSQANNNLESSGAAYVFKKVNDLWSQQAYIKASNTGAGDEFGHSVAIDKNTIVIGSINEQSAATGTNGNQADNSLNNSGAAYVFENNHNTWSQVAYVKASNTGANDLFGYAVAISNEIIVIGAKGEASLSSGINGDQFDNSDASAGAAYVFTISEGNWSQEAYIKANMPSGADQFASSVAIDGFNMVIGAHAEDTNGGNAGAGYVFNRSNGIWSQVALLYGSNTSVSDSFGWSVAISGSIIMVSANEEDSIATGVNGDQDDNSRNSAGAVYVFVNDKGTWLQTDYLKASNLGFFDEFGRSVSVSSGLMAVGAFRERSNSTGINGPDNNSATDSGAVYVSIDDLIFKNGFE